MKRRLLLLGVFIGGVALALGLFLALTATAARPVAAQTEDERLRTIQVSGQGEVQAAPDQAVVRLGVQTEEDTAEAALTGNNEQMTAVISATLETGIEEADIQTEGFRLQPVYESSTNGETSEVVGYRVNNTVQITVRDLDVLGELLDTAVSAGSNNIEGIQFVISNRAELEAEAREAAMINAQQKAEQLTELAGATLGPVQTIWETAGPIPLAAASFESTADASVPIQPGTQTIQTAVQVTWEIR